MFCLNSRQKSWRFGALGRVLQALLETLLLAEGNSLMANHEGVCVCVFHFFISRPNSLLKCSEDILQNDKMSTF